MEDDSDFSPHKGGKGAFRGSRPLMFRRAPQTPFGPRRTWEFVDGPALALNEDESMLILTGSDFGYSNIIVERYL